MLGVLLEVEGQLEERFRRNPGGRKYIRHHRLSRGDGAGLIQRDDLDTTGLLLRRRRLKQDAVSCALSAADHDGDRRCQTECARAGHHQHGDGPRNRKFHTLPGQHPGDEGQQRNEDHGRHKDTGHLIRDPGDRCLRRRRIRNHPDDLAERRVLSDAGRPRLQEAIRVDGRRRYAVPDGLIHRDALTGQGGFIDRTAALEDDTIHRDALARTYHEEIAGLHL